MPKPRAIQDEHWQHHSMETSQPFVEQPQMAVPSEVQPSTQSKPEEPFFFFEDEGPSESHVVTPFQRSAQMPTITAPHPQSDGSGTSPMKLPNVVKTGGKRKSRMLRIIVLVCAAAILAGVAVSVLAQITPALPARKDAMLPRPVPQPSRTGPSQPAPSLDWVPQQLPDGWVNAGLTVGDDIEAARTAATFTDREMSLDFRSIGTRDNHGGTLVAAIFLLTAGGQGRFQQNDVRVTDNALFDSIANMQLIQMAVNSQPKVVQFAVQGQQQFAWADVTFQIWQSKVDPTNPQHRIEGKEMDQAAKQPRTHHMVVLLLRVPPEEEGANPAMGGTGWLVSSYALDQAGGALPNIVQPA